MERAHLNEMFSNLSMDYRRRRAQDNIDPGIDGVGPLEVLGTETYAAQNGSDHHTERFEMVQERIPVVRRGQSFYLGLQLDREFDPDIDSLRLEFDFGPTPSVPKSTKAVLVLGQDTEFTNPPSQWGLIINQTSGSFLTLQVLSPPICPVGIWRCNVITSLLGRPQQLRQRKFQEDIYILFNPWNKADAVYMRDEKDRNEYISNDTGKVWMGSYRQPKGRRWVFGQYDDIVLPTVMYLLELSGLSHADRGNPVHLSRAISAVINADDEDGLLEGRWDGDYGDGTSPHAWTGSLPLMERYLTSGGIPVKYGQCWVFSAIVVTVCRALGLPCRSVTNYVSAHDTNATMTVDKFYSKSGDEIEGGPDGETYDSCWNFHVWNDVWMARPDLPSGYGGWQIIDATPQEESDALYRCGPASVQAVRNGKVGFLYDTPFVFAEVNADVCHFQEDNASQWGFSRIRMNQYHVGRKIVTKAVDRDDDSGDSDMWDVTNFYKNLEGTKEERLAVFNAVKGSENVSMIYDFPTESAQDVTFDLVEIDEVPFGQPFDVVVNLQNNSNAVRTIDAVLSASSVYYTGIIKETLKKATGTFQIQPGQKESMRIRAKPEDYLTKFADHSLVKIFSIASVKETHQTWSEEDDFVLLKPNLTLHINGDLRVGAGCTAVFTFQNPLPRKLTDCHISVEGPGLQRPKMMKCSDVQGNGVFDYTESFHPRRSGPTKIVGTFTSAQLGGIFGSTTLIISP